MKMPKNNEMWTVGENWAKVLKVPKNMQKLLKVAEVDKSESTCRQKC